MQLPTALCVWFQHRQDMLSNGFAAMTTSISELRYDCHQDVGTAKVADTGAA